MIRAARFVTSLASLLALVALGSSCDRDKRSETTTSAGQPTASPSPTLTDTPSTLGAATAAKKREPIVTYKNIGLATPQGIIHDDAADIYIVSNVNGQPTAADGNGFISRLTPDGKVETLKWIEGGKNKVILNAPKGIGLMGDAVYVADIDTVRIFNRKTGAPEGEVKIPGASFLNDIAVTTDGRVLVSDTGTKAGAKPGDAGTDAVWSIDKAKKATPLAKGPDLGGPNGLVPTTDKVWVVTQRTGEMYALDSKGKKSDAKKLPQGKLDGIVLLPGGDVLVSSREASAVFRGKPGGELTPIVEDVKSPADINYDNKRNRLLVPLFELDEVRAYDVPAVGASRP